MKIIIFTLLVAICGEYKGIYGNPLQDEMQEINRQMQSRNSRLIDKDWSIHHSWKLPTFSLPSVTSLFGDDEEVRLKKRIEALETSQKEILGILKRITEAGRSNCGSKDENPKNQNEKPNLPESNIEESNETSTVHPAKKNVTDNVEEAINQSTTSSSIVQDETTHSTDEEKKGTSSPIENENLEKPKPTNEIEAASSVPPILIPSEESTQESAVDTAQVENSNNNEEKDNQLGNDSMNGTTETIDGNSTVNDPTQGAGAAIVAFVTSDDDSSRKINILDEKKKEP